MPHLVTAMFEDHAQARAALQALIEMGIAQNHIIAIGMDEGRACPPFRAFACCRPGMTG